MDTNIVIAICYYAILLTQLRYMLKEKQPKENTIFSLTLPAEAMENGEVVTLRKKYGQAMIGISILLALLPIPLFFIKIVAVQVLLWIIEFYLLIAVSYLPYVFTNKKLKTLKAKNQWHTSEAEIDNLWKCGIFYCNPADKEVNPDTKIGVSNCINHGKKAGKAIAGIVIAVSVIILGLGIVSVGMETAAVSLSYKDGILKAGQKTTNYTLDLDIMQMALFLDELPKTREVSGTETSTLLRGVYNVDGYGNCNVNLNPQNHAFILIQAEEGCYVFSADTDEKTEAVYNKLKQDM